MESNLQGAITGIDQFGRIVEPVSGYRQEKQVGIFFFLWIGQPLANGIYDASKILQMKDGEQILFHQADEKISPNIQPHYWGKPIWGYYNSEDEWVITKQLEMLATAGVDFLVFDTTNTVTYRNVYLRIMAIVEKMQAEGKNPPRVAFYTHTHSMDTVRQLYKEVYSQNLYSGSWYRLDGKPFIVAFTDPKDDIEAEEITLQNKTSGYNPEPYSDEIHNFFTFRRPQWPCNAVDHEDGFAWIEWKFPQPLHGDMMNVSAASHPEVPMSFSITRGKKNFGRGYNPDTGENITGDAEKGAFFQREWDVALQADPRILFINDWNEWIAWKQPWDGEYMLCDSASLEFSRDIEPMDGGYQDAFYLQMIRNIFRFKGLPLETPKKPMVTVDIHKNDWDRVQDVYEKIGCEIARNYSGGSKDLVYECPLPRNSIRRVKVANDRENLYICIECRNTVTPFDGSAGWMNILLGKNLPGQCGYNGYSFGVRAKDASALAITKLTGDIDGEPVGTGSYTVNDHLVQMAVPLKNLEVTDADTSIYFKVWDNENNCTNIMESYTYGSALPMGRLSCFYSLAR